MTSDSEPIEQLSAGEEIFEKWRKRSGALLAPAGFALTYFLSTGLSLEGRKLAAILVTVALLWVCETIPLPVSALLGAVLCVVCDIADAKTVLAYFADPIVFVFIGGFMLARAMMVHKLDRRFALGFLSIPWIGASPARIMGGLGLVTAVISMWVSNSATTAMMLPIALGILRALHEVRVAKGLARGTMHDRHWPFATGMLLIVAYGASLGGLGTPVGSPPNLIGIGLIRAATGVEISFFRWMAITLPLLLLAGPLMFLLLRWLHPADKDGDTGTFLLDYIRNERRQLGPWTRGEINTLIGFGFAVTLWVTPGILQLPWFDGCGLGTWMHKYLPESIVAIAAAVLLFMLPIDRAQGKFTLSWAEAVKIDWGTILLFGGGLALGSLMFKTGVAEALGKSCAIHLGVNSLWLLTGFSIAMAIVLSEISSNTAAANMIIPVVIAIAHAAQISPLPPALGACLGSSFGFMLPVSTPPNAIVYGSGLIPLPKMMRAGILFDITGFFIIWAGLYLLCPLLGLM